MGLIGGGLTVLGTAVGHEYSNAVVSIVFLTLAAGSILYVVIALTGGCSSFGPAGGDLLGGAGGPGRRVRHRHGGDRGWSVS